MDQHAFVCYGYPRIGVLLSLKVGGQQKSAVYDASSLSLVRSWVGGARPTGSEAGNLEGEPFYSYVAQLPEAGSSAVAENFNQAVSFAKRQIISLRSRAGEAHSIAALEISVCAEGFRVPRSARNAANHSGRALSTLSGCSVRWAMPPVFHG